MITDWWNTYVLTTNGSLVVSYALCGFIVGALVGYVRGAFDAYRETDSVRSNDELTEQESENPAQLKLGLEDAARKVS